MLLVDTEFVEQRLHRLASYNCVCHGVGVVLVPVAFGSNAGGGTDALLLLNRVGGFMCRESVAITDSLRTTEAGMFEASEWRDQTADPGADTWRSVRTALQLT